MALRDLRVDRPRGRLSGKEDHRQAQVISGDRTIHLRENESIYLSQETRHRLTNPGQKELVLIEVQSGAYLGEDDIVSIEDDFGR